ncbi:MAG: prepilin peptidase [Defluviitaleaceae bacterium]|nr:prepilin peptidase [Defluviitaleaceae bacterium]
MEIFSLTFIVGSVAASFLNVVAQALPQHQNWWSRRSACPHCHKTLTWKELVPILSFCLQLGKCTFCRSKISRVYLAVEIIGGLLFTLPPIFLSLSHIDLIQAWLFFSLLLTVTLTDLYYQLIPNKILMIFGAAFFFTDVNILTGLIGFLFFYGASLMGKFLFKKETIGGGDIKLYGVIGLVLSYHALFTAILFSSSIALIYVLMTKKNKPIPFAPFIALGALMAYFMSMRG